MLLYRTMPPSPVSTGRMLVKLFLKLKQTYNLKETPSLQNFTHTPLIPMDYSIHYYFLSHISFISPLRSDTSRGAVLVIVGADQIIYTISSFQIISSAICPEVRRQDGIKSETAITSQCKSNVKLNSCLNQYCN